MAALMMIQMVTVIQIFLGNNGPSWVESDGADAFIGNSTQWVDADGDSFGDNPTGTFGDACVGTTESSFEDRFGCVDSDGDGWSNPTRGWTAANGADAFLLKLPSGQTKMEMVTVIIPLE